MKKGIKYCIFAVKQAFYITVSHVCPFLAAFWAFVSVALSVSPFLPDLTKWIPFASLRNFVIVCAGISVLVCLYSYARNFFVCKQGIIRLYENGNRAFYLSIGGYTETMQRILSSDKMLRKLKEKNVRTIAFAMGIDASARLHVFTDEGIVRDVVKTLGEYGLSEEVLQKRFNDNLPERDEAESLEFGCCFSVSLSEVSDNLKVQMDHIRLFLLLISNSKHLVPVEAVNKENRNVVVVEDGRKTVIDLFQYASASEPKIDCIVVGAMGTNAGNFPYAPVLDTIITAYEWCQKRRAQEEIAYPRIVVLSVREWDIKRHNLSLSYIVNRVRSTLKKLD
ncbi:MAG: hypothetical protein LUD84_04760 [Clostridiales bacterium]|nr:hypothetical protein [Clostridiales bacterium]